MAKVPLHEIAVARSGDKGGGANVGVIARSAQHWPTLRAAMTEDLFRRVYGDLGVEQVRIFELPNLHAVNVLLDGVLRDGDPLGGGSTSLRVDAQGKALAQRLLAVEVEVTND
jgi:hypothetical protein